MFHSRTVRLALVVAAGIPAPAVAHHEALFGPQSSLAVEASGFLSLQTHLHANGVNGQETLETTTILSGGIQPSVAVPFGLVLVLPFTYQTSRAPSPPGTTGPFTVCNGCVRLENTLFGAQYRFDFTRLQRAFQSDGNFALVSGAIELPTGNKDYPPLTSPPNFIGAAMVGLERGQWSSVALGYYRTNLLDSTSSKKGDNVLVAVGAAFTPYERNGRMISLQLGLGYEYHLQDVANAKTVDQSGGGQLLISPTLVGSVVAHLRIFVLCTLPVAQTMRGDANVERWRAGVGIIYTFDRSVEVSAHGR